MARRARQFDCFDLTRARLSMPLRFSLQQWSPRAQFRRGAGRRDSQAGDRRANLLRDGRACELSVEGFYLARSRTHRSDRCRSARHGRTPPVLAAVCAGSGLDRSRGIAHLRCTRPDASLRWHASSRHRLASSQNGHGLPSSRALHGAVRHITIICGDRCRGPGPVVPGVTVQTSPRRQDGPIS